MKTDLKVGDEFVVQIGRVAHGGHFIAHSHGRTLFVRHGLTGETARVRVTEVRSKIIRADAVEILESSPHRVAPACDFSGPGGCGGCDFQHVEIAHQRELKEQVVRDSLQRQGHLVDAHVDVKAVDGDSAGLNWRTRVQWGVGLDIGVDIGVGVGNGVGGVVGFHRFRSEEILGVDSCPLAVAELATPPELTARQLGTHPTSIRTGRGTGGEVCLAVDDDVVRGSRRLEHLVHGRPWRVDIDSFWQVHPGAPEALVDAVMAAGNPRTDEIWWDLYSGVGLFSAYLAGGVGPNGHVDAVEGAAQAIRDARRNLHGEQNVTLHHGDVASWVAGGTTRPDGVVLNPPRAGAGERVVRGIAARAPRVVIYVACDPVALARDIAIFADLGYQWAGAQAFDTFPMTHHVEVVATLVPIAASDQIS